MTKKMKRLATTVNQAAKEIGVSDRTVQRMLERRELEGFRLTLRGTYRVYRDSIEKFLRDREIISVPKKK